MARPGRPIRCSRLIRIFRRDKKGLKAGDKASDNGSGRLEALQPNVTGKLPDLDIENVRTSIDRYATTSSPPQRGKNSKGLFRIPGFLKRTGGNKRSKKPYDRSGFVRKEQDRRLLAEELLGPDIPPDIEVRHASQMSYYREALTVAELIPLSEAERRQIVIDIFFRRCKPHLSSEVRSPSELVFDHIKIIAKVAYVHRELNNSNKFNVLERILEETEPSRESDDIFFETNFHETMRAMDSTDWTVDQMIMMLNIVRETSGIESSIIPQEIREMSEEGLSFEKQHKAITSKLPRYYKKR